MREKRPRAERAIFLLAAALLLWCAAGLVRGRPERVDWDAPHVTAALPAPGRGAGHLPELGPLDLGGEDCFHPRHADVPGVRHPGGGTDSGGTDVPDGESVSGSDGNAGGGVVPPEAFPVRLKAVVQAERGERFVSLQDRQTGEYRRLAVGGLWPEHGLRILAITKDDVLLRNDATRERILLRDAAEEPGAPAPAGRGRSLPTIRSG